MFKFYCFRCAGFFPAISVRREQPAPLPASAAFYNTVCMLSTTPTIFEHPVSSWATTPGAALARRGLTRVTVRTNDSDVKLQE